MRLLRLVFHPRTVGVLRAVFGLVFVIYPKGLARGWVGDESEPVVAVSRSVAGRDLVIGSGLAATGNPGWLGASLVSDLTDGAETFTSGVPEGRRVSVRLWAFGFAGYGLVSGFLRFWRG